VGGEGNYGVCSSDCPMATDSALIKDRFRGIRNDDDDDDDDDDDILFPEDNNLAPQ